MPRPPRIRSGTADPRFAAKTADRVANRAGAHAAIGGHAFAGGGTTGEWLGGLHEDGVPGPRQSRRSTRVLSDLKVRHRGMVGEVEHERPRAAVRRSATPIKWEGANRGGSHAGARRRRAPGQHTPTRWAGDAAQISRRGASEALRAKGLLRDGFRTAAEGEGEGLW